MTLDMTETFGLDGTFLGVEVAKTLPSFIHGLPQRFVVLAPTEAWRTEILAILSWIV